MALSITCTPGGPSDNSYITLANADLYFANTLREETWAGYAITQRQRALIQATMDIESLGGPKQANSAKRVRFAGSPRYCDITLQKLHFPRVGDVTGSTTYIVPEAVTRAVCEQAYWLLEEQANPALVDFGKLREEGVSSISLDGISVSLKQVDCPDEIAPQAWKSIRPLIQRVFPVN